MTHIIEYTQDIAERRKVAEALQESEPQLWPLHLNTLVGIFRADHRGNFIYANPALAGMLGFGDVAELLRVNANRLYVDQQERNRLIRAYRRQGQIEELMLRLRRADGQVISVRVTATMTRDSQGEPVIEGFVTDLTKFKAAEKTGRQAPAELQSAHEYSQLVIDSSFDIIVACDLQQRITQFNPAAEQAFGYTREEALGQQISILYSEPDSSVDIWNALLRSGGIVVQTQNRRKNDEQFTNVLSASMIRNEKGEHIGSMGIFRDLNDEIRRQTEHTRAEKLESISVLAGGLAHDFNNFLATFSLNISLALLMSGEDPKLQEILKNSEASIQMVKGLTKQLAALSRGRRPSKVKQDIRPLLRESVTNVLKGTPVEPVFQLADDLWPSEFDISQLNQLIHDLAINAKKVMPDGGRLTVSATNAVFSNQDTRNPRGPGNYLRISFQDKGTGIEPEIMEKIFDPCFSTHREGTGLELYSCHMIMEMHSGWITVDSEVDKSSRFTFYLPVAAPPSDSRILPEPQLSHTGRRLLLVTDDNPANKTSKIPGEPD